MHFSERAPSRQCMQTDVCAASGSLQAGCPPPDSMERQEGSMERNRLNPGRRHHHGSQACTCWVTQRPQRGRGLGLGGHQDAAAQPPLRQHCIKQSGGTGPSTSLSRLCSLEAHQHSKPGEANGSGSPRGTRTPECILVCSVVTNVEAENTLRVGEPQQLQQVCQCGALVPVHLASRRAGTWSALEGHWGSSIRQACNVCYTSEQGATVHTKCSNAATNAMQHRCAGRPPCKQARRSMNARTCGRTSSTLRPRVTRSSGWAVATASTTLTTAWGSRRV